MKCIIFKIEVPTNLELVSLTTCWVFARISDYFWVSWVYPIKSGNIQQLTTWVTSLLLDFKLADEEGSCIYLGSQQKLLGPP